MEQCNEKLVCVRTEVEEFSRECVVVVSDSGGASNSSNAMLTNSEVRCCNVQYSIAHWLVSSKEVVRVLGGTPAE